ncbi:MAG TPA: FtsX-like permease family protein [Steroidobacteraceae bacterium]|jgi:putative ABC transport system permease protein|nr:FtsX-like permease family protein [Steroidobacteraceae bacterium]
MHQHPIFSGIHRNKMGAAVIAVQIALTLAILCNALFIIQQRLSLSARPSGTDEPNLFAIANEWVGSAGDPAARVQADLALLRSLPGVAGAYVTNAYPLTGSGSTQQLSLDPEQQRTAPAAVYLGDEQTLRTLGLRLIAGRNFRAEDVVDRGPLNDPHPAGLIITQALARKLFPDGDVLGRGVYLEGQRGTTPIIGIIDRLQVPWTSIGGWGSAWSDSSIVAPFRDVSQSAYYVVRAQPGRLSELMKSVPRRLVALNHARVINRVQSFPQARAEVYRDDRGLAVILAVVCAVLLAVTAFGIVGLTSYWVAQRRRQIGIRRALGATRVAIVRHFQTENLVIAAAGGIAGVALGVSANLWMVSSFATARLPLNYLLAGAAVVLGLGQLAALRPALRAASVPPAEATRTV